MAVCGDTRPGGAGAPFSECPRIDAINISERQLDYRAEVLADHELLDRVNLYLCDGHDAGLLPDPRQPYDLVIVRGVYTHFSNEVFENTMCAGTGGRERHRLGHVPPQGPRQLLLRSARSRRPGGLREPQDTGAPGTTARRAVRLRVPAARTVRHSRRRDARTRFSVRRPAHIGSRTCTGPRRCRPPATPCAAWIARTRSPARAPTTAR